MSPWNERGILGGLLVVLCLPACAERLALREYTTADGLPTSYIQRIVQDSRGLLWFCTRDGLSRFDGSRFVTYSTQEGLPIPHVNHVLETRKGVYWVATNGGGVARFNPKTEATQKPALGDERRSLFTTFRVGDRPITNSVNLLYEDRQEQVWAGTDGGVFRLETHNGRMEFRRFREFPNEAPVTSFAEDGAGNLWVGSYSGVARVTSGDRLVPRQKKNAGRVNALLSDRQGNLWVGFENGLMVSHSGGEQHWFAAHDGLAGNRVSGLLQARDGHIWVAGDGVAEFDGRRFRTYTRENGIPSMRRGGLTQDRQGNLWLVTLAGVLKLAPDSFTSYGAADGLGQGRIHSIYEDRRGSLVVTGITPEEHVSLHRFEEKRFQTVEPALPADAKAVWPNQGALLGRSGEWWFLTRIGLWRFPSFDPLQLARARPYSVYDRRRGLVRDTVSAAYEDRQGDLWIGSSSDEVGGLTRWDRRRDAFRNYSQADGLQPRWNTPTAFAEDPSGRLWIGFQFGGLAYRDGDRFKTFTVGDGLELDGITALHVDQAGRLWIASTNGVARADDIGSGRPRFSRYTVSDGLSSNNVRCITDDRWGRIYLGTARGIDRLDPRSGRTRHYDTSDGLTSDYINAAFRDSHGALWFSTFTGLSRLDPRPEEPLAQPPIWIDRVRVAGVNHPISENGERDVTGLVVDAAARNIQIDFFSPNFRAGHTLRYQFMLEGADRGWEPPGDQHSVYYASLAPGGYRFLVRAVNAEGEHSPAPAVVSFQVLPPFWKQWWFLTLSAITAISVAYGLHRTRVQRLIEVERLRRRIAADLHDDIGASLSRVAILSEVVKRNLGPENAEPTRRLTEIAETTRGLVDSMSDIVWSVDPRRDDLHNVVLRLRQFSADVLADRSISWDLSAPEGLAKIKLNPDQRRHVYLILKEALTNVARHSGSQSVRMAIRTDNSRICAEIRDDGQGFDPSRTNGHGLENMRSRAAQAGGAISVETSVGAGTRITLDVPVRKFKA